MGLCHKWQSCRCHSHQLSSSKLLCLINNHLFCVSSVESVFLFLLRHETQFNTSLVSVSESNHCSQKHQRLFFSWNKLIREALCYVLRRLMLLSWRYTDVLKQQLYIALIQLVKVFFPLTWLIISFCDTVLVSLCRCYRALLSTEATNSLWSSLFLQNKQALLSASKPAVEFMAGLYTLFRSPHSFGWVFLVLT